MRDIDFTTLRLFVAVCEAGSIARAAAEHHIVASAVSKRMAALESATGVRLLERRRRGVTVTAAGETMLEHARVLLANAERARHDMEAHGSGVRGSVRVLAAISAVAEFLPQAVANFLREKAHREIQVEIEEATSSEVAQGVRAGHAPLGISLGDAGLDGLQSFACHSDHLAIVVHPGHALAKHTSVGFAQTLDYDQVGLPPSSVVQRQFLRAAALAGGSIRYRATVSGFDAVLRVVAAGLAIGVVPREVAVQHVVAAKLKVIPLTDDWAVRSFVVCYRDRATLAPAARALLEHFERSRS